MAVKYIRGPWKLCSAPKNDQWYAGRTIGVDIHGGRRVCDVAEHLGSWTEPTARLIAAAPELYEALRDLEGVISGDDWDGIEYARNVARAALAKAEGRS